MTDMKTVLVAEDNAVNRELVTEMLTAAGFEVVQAADGLEALDLLAARLPDIVLLDLQMPRLEGREALRRIRQNPAWSDLRVIACTAFAMQGEREKLLDWGFDGKRAFLAVLTKSGLCVGSDRMCPRSFKWTRLVAASVSFSSGERSLRPRRHHRWWRWR